VSVVVEGGSERASVVYEGTIRHRRFAPRAHEFRHRIAMAYADGDVAAVRALVPDAALVRTLTLPRRFGKAFSPVSFHYCFDAAERLRAVVAEVTSTPWGDRHSYVLTRSGTGCVLSGAFGKRMHVSPFMGMSQTYLFRAAAPGETLSVHIESVEDGARVFDATLNLRRARDGAHVRVTTPWRALALIYSHALVLKLKRVPVHRHPTVA
jgi:DUF1365 family protein